MKSVEIARESAMSLADASEVDLVEQLIYHRTHYLTTLEQLAAYYGGRGYADKETWAQGELSDARRIRPYHYLLDSEIPRLTLVAKNSIPDADRLYNRAVKVAQRAGHGVPGVYNREQMTEALRIFMQLIREYPSSDKIDDAAFYCGELNKEYFEGTDTVAVRWYECAWTWDAATPHPARFQAAVVCDYRLHDRARAVELYRAAIAAEPNRSNRRWAIERINRLNDVGSAESHRTEPVAPTRSSQEDPAGSSTDIDSEPQPND
jgi:hypothetical protein